MFGGNTEVCGYMYICVCEVYFDGYFEQFDVLLKLVLHLTLRQRAILKQAYSIQLMDMIWW